MNSTLKRFYKHVKQQPCLVCGKYGVDVAHITPLGKHGTWTARSHKDQRAFFAIPLCRECHEESHKHGEAWIVEQSGAMTSDAYPYAYALRLLSEVVWDEDEED